MGALHPVFYLSTPTSIWEIVVAGCTFALAVATGALAWKTKTLADESAADIAAQSRPVLAPVPGSIDSVRPLSFDPNRLQVQIKNAGRGVALDVQASAESRIGVTAAEPWHKAVVSPGDEPILIFGGVPMPDQGETMTVTLRYRDLSNRQHSTVMVIENYHDVRAHVHRPRFYDMFIDQGEPARPVERRPRHQAERAVVTDLIRSRWRKHQRRWLLK